MLDNNDIRAGIVGWIKGNNDIVSVLVSGSSSGLEVREAFYQGEDITYPNIRVTCSSIPNQCNYSDVTATIMCFSEQKSSKQSLILQGRVGKEMHNTPFTQSPLRYWAVRVTNLPDALQQDNGVWRADVILSMKVSNG